MIDLFLLITESNIANYANDTTLNKCEANCCPLVWTCHSRTVNNKIYKLHKRSLENIIGFKEKIKVWIFESYPCQFVTLDSRKLPMSICNFGYSKVTYVSYVKLTCL